MIQEIAVNDLLLDLMNYRLNDPVDQDDALRQIVQDQKGKLVKLAADIAQWGINPSELSIVMAADDAAGKYIDLEGNRRLTALRLLTDASQIDKLDDAHIKESFRKLRKEYPQFKIDSLLCVIAKSREEADHWLQLRHTGENSGRGTVKWNAQASSRFSDRLGRSNFNSIAVKVVESLQESPLVDSTTKSKLENLRLTNLARLLNDNVVRNVVGIESKNGSVEIDLARPEVRIKLEKIIEDVADPDFNVYSIYNKTDRAKYIKTLEQPPQPSALPANVPGEEQDSVTTPLVDSTDQQQAGITLPTDETDPQQADATPPTDGTDLQEAGTTPPTDGATPQQTRVTRSHPQSDARSTLIPSKTRMNIRHPRLNKIYEELRTLRVDDTPNSVAVMLRVFLELSIDEYRNTKQLPAFSKNCELYRKIKVAADYMEAQNILDASRLKAIRVASDPNNTHSLFSTHTLNAYVHNQHIAPVPIDLKITWDNIEEFVIKLWQ